MIPASPLSLATSSPAPCTSSTTAHTQKTASPDDLCGLRAVDSAIVHESTAADVGPLELMYPESDTDMDEVERMSPIPDTPNEDIPDKGSHLVRDIPHSKIHTTNSTPIRIQTVVQHARSRSTYSIIINAQDAAQTLSSTTAATTIQPIPVPRPPYRLFHLLRESLHRDFSMSPAPHLQAVPTSPAYPAPPAMVHCTEPPTAQATPVHNPMNVIFPSVTPERDTTRRTTQASFTAPTLSATGTHIHAESVPQCIVARDLPSVSTNTQHFPFPSQPQHSTRSGSRRDSKTFQPAMSVHPSRDLLRSACALVALLYRQPLPTVPLRVHLWELENELRYLQNFLVQFPAPSNSSDANAPRWNVVPTPHSHAGEWRRMLEGEMLERIRRKVIEVATVAQIGLRQGEKVMEELFTRRVAVVAR